MNNGVTKLKRIAVIQYGWVLQGYSRDFVVGLAERGFQVDFIIDEHSFNTGFIDVVTLQHPNLIVHKLRGAYSPDDSFRRKLDRTLHHYGRLLLGSFYWLVNREDYTYVQSVIDEQRASYSAVIGIEKGGFVIAGKVGTTTGVPYIYYSLELYFQDLTDEIHFQETLKLEKKYHQQAAATIIQDEFRRDALYAYNNVHSQPHIYFPVSVRSLPPANKSGYWHKRFNLREEQRVILYFGLLSVALRSLNEIVQAWKHCGNEYVLVFHGCGDPSDLQSVCAAEGVPNIFISNSMVDEDEIPELISSADIGICIYDNERINNRLTAFSSQKIALFLREGVPVITQNNESYQLLYSFYRCGEPIDSFDSLALTINNIFSDYELYRDNARKAFDDFFSFESNMDKAMSFFDAAIGFR